MRYYIRIYYLIVKRDIIQRFKEKFNCIVSVNGESKIYTNEAGKNLLLESEKRGYIKIRELKEL